MGLTLEIVAQSSSSMCCQGYVDPSILESVIASVDSQGVRSHDQPATVAK